MDTESVEFCLQTLRQCVQTQLILMLHKKPTQASETLHKATSLLDCLETFWVTRRLNDFGATLIKWTELGVRRHIRRQGVQSLHDVRMLRMRVANATVKLLTHAQRVYLEIGVARELASLGSEQAAAQGEVAGTGPNRSKLS